MSVYVYMFIYSISDEDADNNDDDDDSPTFWVGFFCGRVVVRRTTI